MLKEKRQLFEFVFVLSDLLVVALSWCLSYWIRFETDLIPPEKGVPDLSEYLSMIPILWVIWSIVFSRLGLYKPMRGVKRTYELWLTVEANLLSLLFFLSFVYLFREKTVEYSRLVFVIFGILVVLSTIVLRSLLRFFLREARRKGFNLRYVLVVGAGQVALDVITKIRSHRDLGFQLIGCLANGDEGQILNEMPVVGSYSDLNKILSKVDVDLIIMALPLEHNHLLPKVMNDVGDSLVDVKIIPDLYRFVSLGGAIEEFEGLPVISLRTSPLEGYGRYLKRLLDILVSILLLIVLSPVFIITAIALKFSSKGNVLYSQERVSLDGSRFNILKFRTMDSNAESSGPGWTVPGDSRVTSLGKILRTTGLDELPQLFNVLKGDMSIVGPRPERPFFIQEFRQKFPGYMLRHKVPAGITGWAQIHGWRGDTSIDKRIEYDLYYIENWSLLLDIRILILTAFKGINNRNAY